MSSFDNRIIFKQLLDQHHRIQIPMIQRDYAQGRETEEDVRNEFLNALHEALVLDSKNSALPLNLDFIYGSVEGGENTSFLPLDGQQRLTTLFLLHWYSAWKDGCLEHFQKLMCSNGVSRFSYSVRQSSVEFFDALIRYSPDVSPVGLSNVKSLITNQPWYFRYWRLDPTIQASLIMLDSIHKRFYESDGIYSRLTDEKQPAITFEMLEMDNFGLSDDLYIKMNARGKPLTPFENFKARYEQGLKKLFEGEYRNIGEQQFTVTEYFSRRMDTRWADFFWAHRDKRTNLFDEAVMNFFHALIMVTRDPDGDSYVDDITSLRSKNFIPSYTHFHEHGWLDRKFSETLFIALELWSTDEGAFSQHLPNTKYFDEEGVFQKAIYEPSSFDYSDIILFVAYVTFIENHQNEINPAVFQEWMRIVYNLTVNTVYNRPTDMQRCIASVIRLGQSSGGILEYMANPDSSVPGFRQQQVTEEKIKAELIRADLNWRSLIKAAEEHGYFNGQVEFLLNFSGVIASRKETAVSDWSRAKHQTLQKNFVAYFEKANLMFNTRGLKANGYMWERALLCIGDYMLPKGSSGNFSFLVNPATDDASWKRLLRGGDHYHNNQRSYLKLLWDRIVVGDPLEEQLEDMINKASGLSRWVQAFVDTPDTMRYCGYRMVRWESDNIIYLLRKTQMNGTHAELFTYSLYKGPLIKLFEQGKLSPLVLDPYHEVYGTDTEPYILLYYAEDNVKLYFFIEARGDCFALSIKGGDLENVPELEELLRDSLGFSSGFDWSTLEGIRWLVFRGGKEAVLDTLTELAPMLADYS